MLDVSIAKRFPEAPGSAGFSLDVAFQANAGITALFGPSGAGKTLTLASIAGFTRPDRGRIASSDLVLFDSQNGVNLPARARRCGYLFQQGALFPHMTVRENLLFSSPDTASADRLLERFHINGIASRRPHEISGGERQRCAIARTVATRPRLLLMDEPGQALDILLRRELHQVLRELRDELRIPMLLVTHDLAEAFTLADQMLIIDDGKIHDRGAPADLYRRPSSKRTAQLLGLDAVFDGRVVSADSGRVTLQAEGGPLIHIQPQTPLATGAPVSYCLRPDAVVAAPRNGALNPDEIAVRLENVEPTADRVRLTFTGGLAADLSPAEFRRHAETSEWTLRFPENSVWIFPK